MAANLAADPTFTSQFNVKTVITAGSPVAGARIPESIHTLHLENTYDLVPKLDGRLNFDSENHLTIEIDHGTPAPGENLENWVFRNHDRMKTYLKDMQYLEELEPRKLENFLKCRDNALGLDREIASATVTRFETQRYKKYQNRSSGQVLGFRSRKTIVNLQAFFSGFLPKSYFQLLFALR